MLCWGPVGDEALVPTAKTRAEYLDFENNRYWLQRQAEQVQRLLAIGAGYVDVDEPAEESS